MAKSQRTIAAVATRWLSSLRISIFVSVAAISFFAAGSAQAAPATVPLVTFYSPSRGDYFTTSQPEWTCKLWWSCTGSHFLDYTLYEMQGYVYNPALPQPPETLALWHWWSPSRGDNFLTSAEEWNPASSTSPHWDYVFVRVAGYIKAGSVAYPGAQSPMLLKSYWNPTTGDNAALTSPWYVYVLASGKRIRVRWPEGYENYRDEGTLLPPPSAALDKCNAGSVPNASDLMWKESNYIDSWDATQGFVHGDAIRIENSPASSYGIDHWGSTAPFRGVWGSTLVVGWGPVPNVALSPTYPAVGVGRYALLARVTQGRVYVADQGWFEANQWFRALGKQGTEAGPCILYDATFGPGTLEFGVNDDNVHDNDGWARLQIQQYF